MSTFVLIAQDCRCALRFHGSRDVGSIVVKEFVLFWNAAAVLCCSGHHMIGWFQVLLISGGRINHDMMCLITRFDRGFYIVDCHLAAYRNNRSGHGPQTCPSCLQNLPPAQWLLHRSRFLETPASIPHVDSFFRLAWSEPEGPAQRASALGEAGTLGLRHQQNHSAQKLSFVGVLENTTF